MKTLQERTEIQQAYLDGASIEYNDVRNDELWSCCYGEPSFVWVNYDYRIELKLNELDKLFVGAPVMAGNSLSKWHHKDYFHHSVKLRLPTVKEAPRNVWLAPGLEMPEELNQLQVIVRFNTNQFYVLSVLGDFDWEDVEAVMILEDFKKCTA